MLRGLGPLLRRVPESTEALYSQPDAGQQGTYEENITGSALAQESATDQATDECAEELGT